MTCSKLKVERIKREISQETLSEISGVSRATISRIEKGNINSTKLGVLIKIADALDTNVIELFLGDNN